MHSGCLTDEDTLQLFLRSISFLWTGVSVTASPADYLHYPGRLDSTENSFGRLHFAFNNKHKSWNTGLLIEDGSQLPLHFGVSKWHWYLVVPLSCNHMHIFWNAQGLFLLTEMFFVRSISISIFFFFRGVNNNVMIILDDGELFQRYGLWIPYREKQYTKMYLEIKINCAVNCEVYYSYIYIFICLFKMPC